MWVRGRAENLAPAWAQARALPRVQARGPAPVSDLAQRWAQHQAALKPAQAQAQELAPNRVQALPPHPAALSRRRA
jgi:hypothetical protein